MKTRLLAASATLAAAALLFGATALAATPTTQAQKALDYLATQQHPDGSIDGAFGETADYALGAKFHGIDPKTLKAASNKTVYDFLTTWVQGSAACSAVANARDGNSIGKLVQVVVAGGLDPTNFGGRNLLADLEGPGGTTGGAYDATTGTYQDCISYNSGTGKHNNAVYAQANAIMGLDVAGNPAYRVPPAAIQHLKDLQDQGGGWATFGADNSNATAMALMALNQDLITYCGAAANAALTKALAYLHTQQDPASGGFTYSTNYGTSSDPDSDALVIQGLVAVNQDPTAAAWTNANGNPYGDLLTFQDSTSGGFKFDHQAATTPDAFTTSEVPGGLDRAPFPDGSAHPLSVLCTAPSPNPTASTVPVLPRAGSGEPTAPSAPGTAAVALLLAPVMIALARRVRSRRWRRV